MDALLVEERIRAMSRIAEDGDSCSCGAQEFQVLKTPTSIEWVYMGIPYYDSLDLAKAILLVEEDTYLLEPPCLTMSLPFETLV